MTVPLSQILGVLPSGRQAPNLQPDEMARYIREEYLNADCEKQRKLASKKRQDLYADGGGQYMDELLNTTYLKAEVRDRRKAWAPVAKFNNPIKRIVNELSTVYQQPASRRVTGEADDARYRELQRRCRQHERARQWNRLINLHRVLFVGFRVRELVPGHPEMREPVIDIATPDVATVITHPNDSTKMIALIIDMACRPSRTLRHRPKRVVWTDHERFQMTEDGAIIESSYVAHGFARMPWVHVAIDPPIGSFWPGAAGDDLVACTLAVWFANINLLKETKSGTKQAVVSGDATTMARDQANDSEEAIEAPEGVTLSTLDTTADVSVYRDTGDHAIERTANNYGMSAGVLQHQGVQSAEARELMRAPLKELRGEQMVTLREFEREFAAVQAMVLERDMPELAFSVEGWRIKFREVKTPLSAKEGLEVFEHERRLLLTNTVAHIVEQLDVTDEEAWQLVEDNIAIELLRNQLMRPLQEINGTATGGVEDANTPEANGQQGQEPAAESAAP